MCVCVCVFVCVCVVRSTALSFPMNLGDFIFLLFSISHALDMLLSVSAQGVLKLLTLDSSTSTQFLHFGYAFNINAFARGSNSSSLNKHIISSISPSFLHLGWGLTFIMTSCFWNIMACVYLRYLLCSFLTASSVPSPTLHPPLLQRTFCLICDKKISPAMLFPLS